jgi:hypothetical protein
VQIRYLLHCRLSNRWCRSEAFAGPVTLQRGYALEACNHADDGVHLVLENELAGFVDRALVVV